MKDEMPWEDYAEMESAFDSQPSSFRDTMFYLNYEGRGPQYFVIPANCVAPPPGIEGSIAGSRYHDYVYNDIPGPETEEGELAERKHFKAVAEEIWNARPSLYCPSGHFESSACEEWVVCMAAAMLLDAENRQASS